MKKIIARIICFFGWHDEFVEGDLNSYEGNVWEVIRCSNCNRVRLW